MTESRLHPRPDLSIVIPAYNEAHRLPATLEEIGRCFRERDETYEVIVSDDGSSDGTARLAEEAGSRDGHVRVLRNAHRGKGGALRSGVLAAHGALIFIADADLSMPIEEITKFQEAMRAGYDVAIGSRELRQSRRIGEPVYRHLMGRVFNGIVQLAATPGFDDTQCGFKCFTREAGQRVFRMQLFDGFSFDVEVLYLALRLGYRVTEVPVDWYYAPSSRVDPLLDTFRMVRDVLLIRVNDLLGRYRRDVVEVGTADETS